MNIPPKSPIIGEARNQQLLSSATSYIYQQTPAGDLMAHFFFPPGYDYKADARPTIVFFHGGLWDISAPAQFIPHCHHFTTRGMIAVSIEYRNKAHRDGSPEDAIIDAKEAIIFLKTHAKRMGINPEKIVTVGASAGGNAVLGTAVHSNKDEARLSPKPAAMVLFGPISDTTVKGVGNEKFSTPKIGKLLSPSTHVPQKNLPPCLIFHGKADRVVPFEQSARFAKRYSKRGNKCELMEFEKAGHTFFNFNSDEQNYELTLRATDNFLVELGIIEPDPLSDLIH